MKHFAYFLAFCCLLLPQSAALLAASDDAAYTLASQRQVGQIDHVNIVLKVHGDVLTKSGSNEKPDRQEIDVACLRDYDEKTQQLPTEADKTLRGMRYYRDASATLKKAAVVQNPALRPENRTVGVEIAGPKATLYSTKGLFNPDELELVTAVGESLCLDQLLPGKPVKIGSVWGIPNDTVALLLGLEEVTSNSLQMVLTAATPEVARFELAGEVEGKLLGAANRISMEAKCRFDRRSGRIDWFAMRLKQGRDPGLVEDGVDATVLVQTKISRAETSQELSDAALADAPTKPTEDATLVRYLQRSGGYELTHDRTWFLISHAPDYDEFHRLDHGQDIALCKISPQPAVNVSKLPNGEQFQGIVQKLLGDNFGEFLDVSQSESPAKLRILRVRVKGKDGEIPVRWFFYLVSDPEGRQITFAFRVEEKRLDAFGHADEQLVHSLRFVEKKVKEK